MNRLTPLKLFSETVPGVSPMSIPATQYDLDAFRVLLNAQATIINGILDLIEGNIT